MPFAVPTDPLEAANTSIWTVPAFRARNAHQRHLEVKAQDVDELGKRDQAIREAIDGGARVAELAPFVGLTRASIYGIVGTAP